ncbi:PAS domain-containing protein [Sporosarcina aquimarina]|uniref:STAS domain-containing protein n=1 Tax=Sporosarcina aquimarina TaxID=114975 RepID=UPI00204080D0|nr:PAS domain-containing protein [Sporosarcina aquimarina]MCM3757955.1 PAS domain-containing protein [Sporosarcina aquimarina]
MKKLDQSVQNQLLEAMLDGSRVATLVTDPSQPDNPIIYANRTFESMTGYPLTETLGRNCRFLQGEDTNPLAVKQLRDAIQDQKPITITLKNYKKDGTDFWNRLSVTPLQIEDHLFFIGTQTNVSVEYKQRDELSNKDSEIEQLMLPIMMIQDNLAAVSLIGEMSPQRFNLLTQKLSEFVQHHEVDHIIIDITGLVWNHESPLTSLLAIQDVLKLMGTQLYVTGISPKVAQSLVSERLSDQQLLTFSSIRQAMDSIQ